MKSDQKNILFTHQLRGDRWIKGMRHIVTQGKLVSQQGEQLLMWLTVSLLMNHDVDGSKLMRNIKQTYLKVQDWCHLLEDKKGF